MKRNILLISAIILASCLINSCTHSEKDLAGGALIRENAILYLNEGNSLKEANPMKINEISLPDTAMTAITKSFVVKLNKPYENKDLNLYLLYSKDRTEEYMSALNLKGEVLDPAFLTFDKKILISKGQMKSEPINLKVKIDTNLRLGHTYYFAICLSKTPVASQASDNSETAKSCDKGALTIYPINSTVLFSVERQALGQDIFKVLEIKRDVYLKPVKTLPDLKKDITVECLVNVNKFRGPGDPGEAGISTLMGIEGESLMRFGDAGVPANYLQVNGQKINFPFSTNKWYHVAEVYNAAESSLSVYIDGNLISTFDTNFTIYSSSWYIGKSWSDGRGLDGELSEIRIWSTARSQQDLKDNMYNVNPKSKNLEVYWKMDNAKSNIVPDATGHGYDLEQLTQPGSDKKDVSIIKLSNALTIDE